MKIGIYTWCYDTWISDEENFDDEEDLAWFKEECGLSREDLFRILARAKEIGQEYKLTSSEIEKLSYDIDGAWFIHFDDDREMIYHEDQTITQQRADMAVAK